MAEQWYWKHQRDLLGPMDTEELDELIQNGRVGDRDELQISGSEEWLKGKAVKKLFADAQRAREGGSSEAASDLLKQGRHSRITGPVPSSRSNRSVLTPLFDAFGRLAAGLLEKTLVTFGIAFSCLRKVAKCRLTLLVIAFVLLSLLLLQFDLSSQQNSRIYAEYLRMYNEIQQATASKSLTPALQADLLAKHQAAQSSLLNAGNSHGFTDIRYFLVEKENQDARTHLIQASYRLEELIKQQNKDSLQEVAASFESEMESAGKVLDGTYHQEEQAWQATFEGERQYYERSVSGDSADDHHDSQPNQAMGTPSESAAGSDKLWVVIVGIDVLLLVSGVVYVLRRRRAHSSI